MKFLTVVALFALVAVSMALPPIGYSAGYYGGYAAPIAYTSAYGYASPIAYSAGYVSPYYAGLGYGYGYGYLKK